MHFVENEVMNQQEQINKFLKSLADFIEQYYSSAVTQINVHSEDDWVKIIIINPAINYLA